MSALADSSPPPKMLDKRFFDYRSFKHRKVDAVRRYPRKCGPGFDSPFSVINHPTSFKRRKVDAVRCFPKNCGGTFGAGVNSSSNEIIELPNATIDLLKPNERFELPIAAVPLRCVPLIGVEREHVHSLALESGDGDGDDEKGITKHNVMITSLDDDMEKLAKVVAEAKDYLNDFDIRYSSCGDKRKAESVCLDLDQCASVGEMEEDCELNSDVVDCDIDSNTAITCYQEPQYYDENQNDLVNLKIVRHEEPEGVKVAEVLKVFKEYYDEFTKKQLNMKPRGGGKILNAHLWAAKRLKNEGMYIFPEKSFGHVPGVEIGDEFQFRSQLSIVGLHRVLVSGIDHVTLCGKKYATSVVDSGRYENTFTKRDILIYSGQGGNLKIVDNSVDQKLVKGNIALMNSKEIGYPVRVIFKRKSLGGDTSFVYVYDGLYKVNKAWQERDHGGKLVFKFELHRMANQFRSCNKYADLKRVETRREEVCMANDISRGKEKDLICAMDVVDDNQITNVGLKMSETRMEGVCIVDDISRGKEKKPIHALYDVDGIHPPTFIYVTSMVYPSWFHKFEPIGCDCVDGCSDSHQCACIVKNGGEIPYNENGFIIKATARVHECGPLCKCPPTCMNRVSQHGPRYELEIFKTEHKGWGVRSLDLIPSGGFVCEYIGEFLREKDADLRVGRDEYLFDVCKGPGGHGNGYSIDAAVYGNIGRFFNHSCSPNMYAQKVIYDHDDHRMPHIMFFATEDIPPLKELTYHYNYKVGTVCDADGNVKAKECFCGSHKCSKRLY